MKGGERVKEQSYSRIRINHKGKGALELAMAMEEVAKRFRHWIEQKKKFRVTIDYDPEWTLLFRFRFMTKEEAEEMDNLRPTKEEMASIKAFELDRQ